MSSTKKTIMLVFGTRPEAIKMAPVYHALASRPVFETMVCASAQHRQMLDQALKAFDITPDVDLDIMRAGQDLFDVTSSVLLGMRGVLQQHRPDAVLVHGDTTTTLAASMAAFYAGIPLGHVEAGLRTFDLRAPFPEEFNRQVATKVARWHFAPTTLSRDNLLREGVPDSQVVVTGNTVVDALFWTLERIQADTGRRERLDTLLNAALPFEWRDSRIVLITGHRRENFGAAFENICRAIYELARQHTTTHFVYPVHLNPNVQKPVRTILQGLANVHLIEPLDYEPFVVLIKHSHLVLTDSGGIQEEAPSLGKPVLVMRTVTERPEGVAAGTVRLVGAARQAIVDNVTELLTDVRAYRKMSLAHNPYGDGSAALRIADYLQAQLS